MPKQYHYAAPIYRTGSLLPVYTKDDLKNLSADYTSLVAENEISIFTKHITDSVVIKAAVGGKTISFSILPLACPITHDAKGLLNKEEPGPIPEIYLDRILKKLDKIFPDSEIITDGLKMYLRWS
jgi:hypothetical protein